MPCVCPSPIAHDSLSSVSVRRILATCNQYITKEVSCPSVIGWANLLPTAFSGKETSTRQTATNVRRKCVIMKLFIERIVCPWFLRGGSYYGRAASRTTRRWRCMPIYGTRSRELAMPMPMPPLFMDWYGEEIHSHSKNQSILLCCHLRGKGKEYWWDRAHTSWIGVASPIALLLLFVDSWQGDGRVCDGGPLSSLLSLECQRHNNNTSINRDIIILSAETVLTSFFSQVSLHQNFEIQAWDSACTNSQLFHSTYAHCSYSYYAHAVLACRALKDNTQCSSTNASYWPSIHLPWICQCQYRCRMPMPTMTMICLGIRNNIFSPTHRRGQLLRHRNYRHHHPNNVH